MQCVVKHANDTYLWQSKVSSKIIFFFNSGYLSSKHSISMWARIMVIFRSQKRSVSKNVRETLLLHHA